MKSRNSSAVQSIESRAKEMKFSVIVPCYNSQDTIREVVESTRTVFEQMGETDYEFVLVNDYSPNEETLHELQKLAGQYPFVKVIDLAKNFGQANAQMAGLNYAQGAYIINMDDDLQTHPSNIPLLYGKLCEGYDLVFARYKKKQHNKFRNLLTFMGAKFDEICLERPKDISFTSFWICKKFIRDELIKYQYPYSFMEGLFLRTARNIANVEIEHRARQYGHSGYNFKKLVKLWSNFTNFTVLPLRIAGVIGFLSALLGFFYALFIVIKKLLDPGMPMGYASLICIVLIFFGITLFCIGMLGEYVGRTFLCVNNSPQYVVRETYNVEQNENMAGSREGAVVDKASEGPKQAHAAEEDI